MARASNLKMSEVIVIGAGIGGMSAAARLAKAGHKVKVFEASSRTGGKCQTKWIGDYAFDTGPSLLTLPAVYRDLFLKTGKRIENVLEIEPVDPAFTYNFSDQTKIVFPNLSLTGICNSIERALGKDAGNQWHNLMQRAEHMWDVSRGPFVESELKSIFKLLRRKNFLGDLRVIAPLISLRKLTSRYTTNPYLTKIIDRYATYSGSDPRKVPAVLLTIAFVESTFGAWHIKGGVGELATALELRCRDLGVEFFLETPVTKITYEAQAVTGVMAASKFYPTEFVVANADAQIVYKKLLPDELRVVDSERKKLSKSTKSLGGFSLLLGLDNDKITGQIPELSHHNIYFPKDYDSEFDDIFLRKIPVSDPTIYICAPKDSKMVKGENKEAWSVLINAPRHEPGIGWDWRNNPDEYAKKIIAKLDGLGLRVSERLEVMEFITPFDLENSVGAPGGSIYGTSSNGARSAFLRASNTSPLKNLYCVGGSAHPGGGLPLVGISAEIVAEAIGRAK
jgi:phytoene desaturase